jgi:hypothetical protein
MVHAPFSRVLSGNPNSYEPKLMVKLPVYAAIERLAASHEHTRHQEQRYCLVATADAATSSIRPTEDPGAVGSSGDRNLSPPTQHLNQVELARRWRISPRTLERWRWSGHGPPYMKIGGRVVYRLADIEAFEAAQTRR